MKFALTLSCLQWGKNVLKEPEGRWEEVVICAGRCHKDELGPSVGLSSEMSVCQQMNRMQSHLTLFHFEDYLKKRFRSSTAQSH